MNDPFGMEGGTTGKVRESFNGVAGRGCGTLFFGAFFAVGALFVIILLGEAIAELAPWRWAETPCTIIDSRVLETDEDQRPYRALVRYRLEVDGRVLEGDRVTRTDQGSASYDRARDRAARYPVGTVASCRFDPQSPALTVLELRPPWMLLTVFFPMIFVAIGAVGLYALWRPVRAPSASGIESISQKAPKLKGHRISLVLGLIFATVGGSLFVVLFAAPAVRTAQTLTWSQQPCTVVSSTLRSWSTDDGTSYRADVLYDYRAGGRSWRSNRVDFFPLTSAGRDGARAILDRYPSGSTVTCWVDPDDASRSVLDRRLRPLHLLGLLPLLFLFAGLGLAVHSRRSLRAAAVETPLTVGAAGGPLQLEPQVGPIGKVAGSLFFALFWNGIVSVFVWQAWKSWQRGDPDWFLMIFLIPFVLVGLGAFAFVGHFTLALANPRPRLTLQGGRPCLGDELRVDWSFSGRASRLRRLRIVLEGREEATYRRGTDTVTDREAFATLVLADTTNDWEIPRGQAAVLIPDDTMHSFEGDNNKIVWEIKVSGTILRWPDVDESFPLTIQPLRAAEV